MCTLRHGGRGGGGRGVGGRRGSSSSSSSSTSSSNGSRSEHIVISHRLTHPRLFSFTTPSVSTNAGVSGSFESLTATRPMPNSGRPGAGRYTFTCVCVCVSVCLCVCMGGCCIDSGHVLAPGLRAQAPSAL